MALPKGCSLRFSCGTATAEMRTDHLELGDFLKHIFGRFLTHESFAADTRSDHSSGWRTELDGRVHAEADFVDAVLDLEITIEDTLLSGVDDGILLHGAAVSKRGRHLLILGPAHAGKTTMVMELTRRGYTFLGDEYVLLDAGATRLLPFPRCATLRQVVGELPAGTHRELRGHPDGWSFFMPDDSVCPDPQRVDDLSVLFVQHRPTEPVTLRKSEAGETTARMLQQAYDLEGRESTCWHGLSSLAVKADARVFEFQQVQRDLDLALAGIAVAR